MGNLEADENGNAHMEYTDNVISLHGEHSIIGRGIIVHAVISLLSQPAIQAGA